MAESTQVSEVPWSTRRRVDTCATRCPNSDADPSQAVVEAWHNFTGEAAEHRVRMGEYAGPPHARIEVTHDCGWSVSFPACPLAWTYASDAVFDHFGTLESAVPRG